MLQHGTQVPVESNKSITSTSGLSYLGMDLAHPIGYAFFSLKNNNNNNNDNKICRRLFLILILGNFRSKS